MDVSKELCFKDKPLKKTMVNKYASYLAKYTSNPMEVVVSPQEYWEAMNVTDPKELSTKGNSLRNQLYNAFKSLRGGMYENYLRTLRRDITIQSNETELVHYKGNYLFFLNNIV